MLRAHRVGLQGLQDSGQTMTDNLRNLKSGRHHALSARRHCQQDLGPGRQKGGRGHSVDLGGHRFDTWSESRSEDPCGTPCSLTLFKETP